MNILFLSLSRFENINDRGIYNDLMREFIRQGNKVYIASPTERRYGKPTTLTKGDNFEILNIWTLNILKTNIVEKGIGTLMLGYQFNRAITKYWNDVKFNLVLYATPPITFNKVIEQVKKRCDAHSYLMLKDIFPQNAVDLGMMKTGGMLYKVFRRKEEKLYQISDRIGCMSPANRTYIIEHNPAVNPALVEVCPNAVEPIEFKPISDEERSELLAELNIPVDKTIFIYGGNLGKPQGIDFLFEILVANEKRNNSFIIIVGSGTEFSKLQQWFDENKPKNAKLLSALPKEKYDNLIKAAHVGLVLLDPRFTIPNFPSRLLSYLENRMPVLLATDPNTDIGKIAEENGFGFWCLNGDLKSFMANIDRITKADRITMGEQGLKYLLNNYTVDKAADIIINSITV